jgi:hypothetical protein
MGRQALAQAQRLWLFLVLHSSLGSVLTKGFEIVVHAAGFLSIGLQIR